jgi:hypothetical protein
MMPLALVIRIDRCDGTTLRLWLPLFVLWLLLLPFALILLPFVLLAAAIFGGEILAAFAAIAALLAALRGTHVEVAGRRSDVFIHVY